MQSRSILLGLVKAQRVGVLVRLGLNYRNGQWGKASAYGQAQQVVGTSLSSTGAAVDDFDAAGCGLTTYEVLQPARTVESRGYEFRTCVRFGEGHPARFLRLPTLARDMLKRVRGSSLAAACIIDRACSLVEPFAGAQGKPLFLGRVRAHGNAP